MGDAGEQYGDAGDYGQDGQPTPTHEEVDAAALLSRIKTGAWLNAQEFPPLRWAVPGIIPEGFGLFTGAPKIGKSWAALGLGLAVAAGGYAFGKVRVGPARPVLYLALEDGQRRLQWRSRALLHGEPIPDLFHEVTELRPAEVLPLIRAWLTAHGSLRPLVMLDTLGKVMPPAMAGEGAYNRDYRIGSDLKRLVDAHPGSTLLVVHHVRKASGEDWMDSTSGTNGLNGAADFTLNLHRKRTETVGLLRVTGRDVEEGEYAVRTADGEWTLDGADLAQAALMAETARTVENLGDENVRIIEFVARQGQPVGAPQVKAELGIERAGTYLDRLFKSGRLVKPSRGLYSMPVQTVQGVYSEDGDDASQITRGVVCNEGNQYTVCTEYTGVEQGEGVQTDPDLSDVPCRVCSRLLSVIRAEYGKTTCADHDAEEGTEPRCDTCRGEVEDRPGLLGSWCPSCSLMVGTA